jgi:serine/threonine-protein phosphatase PP1 catalytic subunit
VLPLAAVISDRIFCVHGGLSPSISALEDISDIQRPLPMDETNGLTVDLLWSDPVINIVTLGCEYRVLGNE